MPIFGSDGVTPAPTRLMLVDALGTPLPVASVQLIDAAGTPHVVWRPGTIVAPGEVAAPPVVTPAPPPTDPVNPTDWGPALSSLNNPMMWNANRHRATGAGDKTIIGAFCPLVVAGGRTTAENCRPYMRDTCEAGSFNKPSSLPVPKFTEAEVQWFINYFTDFPGARIVMMMQFARATAQFNGVWFGAGWEDRCRFRAARILLHHPNPDLIPIVVGINEGDLAPGNEAPYLLADYKASGAWNGAGAVTGTILTALKTRIIAAQRFLYQEVKGKTNNTNGATPVTQAYMGSARPDIIVVGPPTINALRNKWGNQHYAIYDIYKHDNGALCGLVDAINANHHGSQSPFPDYNTVSNSSLAVGDSTNCMYHVRKAYDEGCALWTGSQKPPSDILMVSTESGHNMLGSQNAGAQGGKHYYNDATFEYMAWKATQQPTDMLQWAASYVHYSTHASPDRINPISNITGIANDGGAVRLTFGVAHGLANGNEIYITDIKGGYASLNTTWIAANVSTNSVTLTGTTYTGAGWTQAANGGYAHKAGRNGYNLVAPGSLTKRAPWYDAVYLAHRLEKYDIADWQTDFVVKNGGTDGYRTYCDASTWSIAFDTGRTANLTAAQGTWVPEFAASRVLWFDQTAPGAFNELRMLAGNPCRARRLTAHRKPGRYRFTVSAATTSPTSAAGGRILVTGFDPLQQLRMVLSPTPISPSLTPLDYSVEFVVREHNWRLWPQQRTSVIHLLSNGAGEIRWSHPRIAYMGAS